MPTTILREVQAAYIQLRGTASAAARKMLSKGATYEEGEGKTDKIMQECFHAFLDQLMRQGQGLQAQQKVKAVRRLLCKPLWKDDFRREMDRKISELAMEGVTSVVEGLQSQLMQAIATNAELQSKFNNRNLMGQKGISDKPSANQKASALENRLREASRKLREKKEMAQILKQRKDLAHKNQKLL